MVVAMPYNYTRHQLQVGCEHLFKSTYGIPPGLRDEFVIEDGVKGVNSIHRAYETLGRTNAFIKIQTNEACDHIGFDAVVSYAVASYDENELTQFRKREELQCFQINMWDSHFFLSIP
jgi:hypothetical protein